MYSKLTLVLILLFGSSQLFPCTIIPKTFCKSIQNNPDYLIVSGKIISIDSDGLDLEVIDVLRGQETKSTIRIWDGTDFDCNGPFPMSCLSIGNVNDSVVISLPRIEDKENTWDVIGDYRRPDPYFHTSELRIENGIVKGLIQGDAIAPPEFNLLELPYSNLKESIIINDECKDLRSNINEIVIIEDIVFQNPIHNDFQIKNVKPSDIKEINIYSIDGKKIVHRAIETNEDLNFNLIDQNIGLHVLEIISKNNIRKTFPVIIN